MKKLFLISIIILFSTTLSADESKTGFLTSKWCAQNGLFTDCRLESIMCGYGDCFKEEEVDAAKTGDLVVFVHDEGKYYNIKLVGGLQRYKLDTAINRNSVEIIGRVEGDTIFASSFKAPPPPKKSFFKGCL